MYGIHCNLNLVEYIIMIPVDLNKIISDINRLAAEINTNRHKLQQLFVINKKSIEQINQNDLKIKQLQQKVSEHEELINQMHQD